MSHTIRKVKQGIGKPPTIMSANQEHFSLPNCTGTTQVPQELQRLSRALLSISPPRKCPRAADSDAKVLLIDLGQTFVPVDCEPSRDQGLFQLVRCPLRRS